MCGAPRGKTSVTHLNLANTPAPRGPSPPWDKIAAATVAGVTSITVGVPITVRVPPGVRCGRQSKAQADGAESQSRGTEASVESSAMETAVEAATKAPGRRCGWCKGAECCSRKQSDHRLPEHNPILLVKTRTIFQRCLQGG